MDGTKVTRVQYQQADVVSESVTPKLGKTHKEYSGNASLMGSLIADLANESREVKVRSKRGGSRSVHGSICHELDWRGQQDGGAAEHKVLRHRRSDSIEGRACVRSDWRRRDCQGDQILAPKPRLALKNLDVCGSS